MKDKLIEALNLAKAGKWVEAHEIVQKIETEESYRIHAYLHRVEGDLGNARYWYNRAKAVMPDGTEEEEWEMLFASLSEI